jgi:diguanylate cyclase (GGDEF)-like protein
MFETAVRDTREISMMPPQEAKANLRILARQETGLWAMAFAATLLAAAALVMLSVPTLLRNLPYVRLDAEATRQGLVALLLVLNAWVAYRQWEFRRLRKGLTGQLTGNPDWPEQRDAPGVSTPVDPVTGLSARPAVEPWLAREIAHCRRDNKPLTLLLLGLDDFEQVNTSFGPTYANIALQEFAKHLKRASRGTDLAARLGEEEFLLGLPDCPVGAAQKILDRLPGLEVKCGGKQFSVSCSTATIDYQTGESPAEFLKRADDLLKLYRNLAESVPATLTAN